jgi:hypothetical protein
VTRHLTRHGGNREDDALTTYVEQTALLARIFDAWQDTAPPVEADPVKNARRHGTLDKLIVEHVAVRLAARDDIVRVLREHGADEAAAGLDSDRDEVARQLGRLDHLARGRQPVSLGGQTAFEEEATRLRALLVDDLGTDRDQLERPLVTALGEHRSDLHSSQYITKHAPTHPAPLNRWYRRLSVVHRVQATYDRLRGFPWAESEPFADPRIAERFDPDQ